MSDTDHQVVDNQDNVGLKLTTFRLVRNNPLTDPLGLHGTLVTAPTQEEGAQLVHQSAGLLTGTQPSILTQEYTFVVSQESQTKLSRTDWIDAIDGQILGPPVVLPEGFTSKAPEPSRQPLEDKLALVDGGVSKEFTEIRSHVASLWRYSRSFMIFGIPVVALALIIGWSSMLSQPSKVPVIFSEPSTSIVWTTEVPSLTKQMPQVAAGTIIPVVFTGVATASSSATFTAVVTHDVWDTMTGEQIMLPKGSMFVYSGVPVSRSSPGQIRWTSVRRPDGTLLSFPDGGPQPYTKISSSGPKTADSAYVLVTEDLVFPGQVSR